MCPFLEKSEARCSTHLNLRNIVQAFAHCAGRYRDCPVYRGLRCSSRPAHHASHTDAFAFLAAS